METYERSEQETPSVARWNRKDAARGSGANAGGVSRRDAARTAPDPEGFLINNRQFRSHIDLRFSVLWF